jgi:hypothetical protein
MNSWWKRFLGSVRDIIRTIKTFLNNRILLWPDGTLCRIWRTYLISFFIQKVLEGLRRIWDLPLLDFSKLIFCSFSNFTHTRLDASGLKHKALYRVLYNFAGVYEVFLLFIYHNSIWRTLQLYLYCNSMNFGYQYSGLTGAFGFKSIYSFLWGAPGGVVIFSFFDSFVHKILRPASKEVKVRL